MRRKIDLIKGLAKGVEVPTSVRIEELANRHASRLHGVQQIPLAVGHEIE
jgi:hypothetical protein